jgi:hypothetical protein
MRKDYLGLAAAVAVLCCILAWRMGWPTSEPAPVKEIKTLAQAPPSKENRDAIRDVIRQQTDGMTDDQKASFFEQLAPVFIPIMAKRFEEEYDKFMAMTPEQQRKKLDERIDEMRKRGGPPGSGPGGGDRRGPPPMSPQKMEEFRKKMLDWTTPDQRAKFENGIQMFNDRLKQRGMDPVDMPGGGVF